MSIEPIFREIDSGSDYSLLSPGLYSIGCGSRIDFQEIAEKISGLSSFSCLNNCFCGILLPFFLHNMNNLLVGVTGNIDLAGMFMPDISRVETKIDAARTATGSLVEYIRDISQTMFVDSGNLLSNECLKRAMILLRAAAGRSVSTKGVEGMKLEESVPCTDLSSLQAALNGMVSWCVISVGGSGSIGGSIKDSVINFNWQRPPGAGLPAMPGVEHITSVISITGALAFRAGCILVVENWTDYSGGISLVIK